MPNFDLAAWCNEFFSAPTTPLKLNEFAILTTLLNAEHAGQEPPAELMDAMKDDNFYRVAENIFHRQRSTLSIFTKVFLLFLCENPASITMYAAALNSLPKPVTLDALYKMFPNGFLSEASLRNLWGRQKIDSTVRQKLRLIEDNYLDYLANSNRVS